MTTSIEWLLRCWSSSDIPNVVSPIINTFFLGLWLQYHQSGKPLGKRRYSLLFTGLSLSDPSVFVRRRGTRGKELVSSEIRQVVEGEGFCWEKGWTSHLPNFRKNDCLFSKHQLIWTMGYQGFERTEPERPMQQGLGICINNRVPWTTFEREPAV